MKNSVLLKFLFPVLLLTLFLSGCNLPLIPIIPTPSPTPTPTPQVGRLTVWAEPSVVSYAAAVEDCSQGGWEYKVYISNSGTSNIVLTKIELYRKESLNGSFQLDSLNTIDYQTDPSFFEDILELNNATLAPGQTTFYNSYGCAEAWSPPYQEKTIVYGRDGAGREVKAETIVTFRSY